MIRLDDLAAGDRVAMCGARDLADAILPIERVGRREIRTAGEVPRRWSRADGFEIGYRYRRIRPLRDGDEESAERAPLRAALENARHATASAALVLADRQRRLDGLRELLVEADRRLADATATFAAAESGEQQAADALRAAGGEGEVAS